jgi:ergothioneine biosynthesis protein EgtB
MSRENLIIEFLNVRKTTEDLCSPLSTEDYVVQPIDDVSPPKWHLGHTTWFFERVILHDFEPNYSHFHESYHYIFNSYYEAFGDRVERALRGSLSRPTVDDVIHYRKNVTARTVAMIENIDDEKLPEMTKLLVLGMNHEQQHQELFLMDIKYIFGGNLLRPVYHEHSSDVIKRQPTTSEYVSFDEGVYKIGANNPDFAYDNEFPRHKTYADSFKLAKYPVTCGEYLEFINDGGYVKANLWLSDGWDVINSRKWDCPLYWERDANGWHIITLSGTHPLNPGETVCHISFYEAAAFARWAGKRLPTEAEWEIAAASQNDDFNNGNFMDDKTYHPLVKGYESEESGKLTALLGDIWEWTGSAYLPYPGYFQSPGALGEYNGKFMSNQMVLRGGCCATPRNHIRKTYRNFFQPDKRWQFSGLRLADGS